jgi:catalase
MIRTGPFVVIEEDAEIQRFNERLRQLRDGNDDYTRAGNLFRLMNPEQCKSIVRHMQTGNTPQEIQLRQIRRFFRADPAYGISIAQALGLISPS